MGAAENWLSIEYRDFYDIPRAFFVRVDDRWLFVESRFDEDADDHGPFDVFDMGERGPDGISDDWTLTRDRAVRRLGAVQLSPTSFDETRRLAVARSALTAVLS